MFYSLFRYAKYHMWFGLCEFMNIISIILSVGLCHWLLNYQFAFYGLKVIEYLGTQKKLNSLGQYVTHDPMCELFPTEVSETTLSNLPMKTFSPNSEIEFACRWPVP